MKVLVAYATRHGATAGIASRIADSLTASGHDASAVPVENLTDIDGYQAVVLGSAAFMWCRRAPSTIDVTHSVPRSESWSRLPSRARSWLPVRSPFDQSCDSRRDSPTVP